MVFKYSNKILVLNDREKCLSNIIFKNNDLFDYNVLKYKEHYIKYVVDIKTEKILLVDIIPSKQCVSSWVKLYKNITLLIFFLCECNIDEFRANVIVLNDILTGDVFNNTDVIVITNKTYDVHTENEKKFQNDLLDIQKKFPAIKYINNLSKSVIIMMMYDLLAKNTTVLSKGKFHISEVKPKSLQRGWSN
jgi:hypothetical protein